MDHPFKIPSKKSRPLYRIIREESAILWEMIVCVILSKNVHMNMGPILNGYRDMIKRGYGPSVQNRTHVHMICFCLESHKYHFPKYCRFLLNHPLFGNNCNKSKLYSGRN